MDEVYLYSNASRRSFYSGLWTGVILVLGVEAIVFGYYAFFIHKGG